MSVDLSGNGYLVATGPHRIDQTAESPSQSVSVIRAIGVTAPAPSRTPTDQLEHCEFTVGGLTINDAL